MPDDLPLPMPNPPKIAPRVQPSKPGRFSLLSDLRARGERIVLYGPGGIGKTTLAAMAPGPVAFFDLDDSLVRLRRCLGACPTKLDVRVAYVQAWDELIGALTTWGDADVKTVVIDTVTKAEELCVAHTLKTVPINPDRPSKLAKTLEEYGWGKGYQHNYDTFLPLLSVLDTHAEAGRNVVLIAHDCTTMVPNPRGEDYLRYEPRLQSPGSGKGSIRLRVREWADHLIFIGYDLAVDADGKAKGSGSRAAYPQERAFAMAKSRTLPDREIALPLWGMDLWNQIFAKE